MITRARGLALGALFLGLAAAGPALAAPYSITHTGQLASSSLPGVNNETYDITIVFDNGGTVVASQTWDVSDVRCVIWRFNDARDVTLTQNLVGSPPNVVLGSVTTDAGGVLTSNFDEFNDTNLTNPANFVLTGAAWTLPIQWYANDVNGIVYENGGGDVDDAAGGVQMAPAGWSNPAPFSGNCAGLVLGAAPPTVPTMSDFALWLMGFSLLVAGFFYTRRWAVGA